MPFTNLPRKTCNKNPYLFIPQILVFFDRNNQGTEMGATSSREVKLKGSGHNSTSIRKRQECTISELFPCAWNKKNGCLVGREWDVRCELCWSVGCLLCWKEFLEKEVFASGCIALHLCHRFNVWSWRFYIVHIRYKLGINKGKSVRPTILCCSDQRKHKQDIVFNGCVRLLEPSVKGYKFIKSRRMSS